MPIVIHKRQNLTALSNCLAANKFALPKDYAHSYNVRPICSHKVRLSRHPEF